MKYLIKLFSFNMPNWYRVMSLWCFFIGLTLMMPSLLISSLAGLSEQVAARIFGSMLLIAFMPLVLGAIIFKDVRNQAFFEKENTI